MMITTTSNEYVIFCTLMVFLILINSVVIIKHLKRILGGRLSG